MNDVHPTSSDGPVVRASDAERDRTRTVLREAATAGRLSTEEVDERLGSVGAARFRNELATLVADLPPSTSSARRATGAVGSALTALYALIGRHRVIGAAVVIVLIAAVVGSIVWAGSGHEREGFDHSTHARYSQHDGRQ